MEYDNVNLNLNGNKTLHSAMRREASGVRACCFMFLRLQIADWLRVFDLLGATSSNRRLGFNLTSLAKTSSHSITQRYSSVTLSLAGDRPRDQKGSRGIKATCKGLNLVFVLGMNKA